MRANWAVDRIFEPHWSEDKREAGYRGWRKAVQRAMKWV
jgi:glycerol kinase